MRYGVLEGRPVVRLADRSAWWLIDGEWREITQLGEVMDTTVLTEEAFKARFPDLPELRQP